MSRSGFLQSLQSGASRTRPSRFHLYLSQNKRSLELELQQVLPVCFRETLPEAVHSLNLIMPLPRGRPYAGRGNA